MCYCCSPKEFVIDESVLMNKGVVGEINDVKIINNIDYYPEMNMEVNRDLDKGKEPLGSNEINVNALNSQGVIVNKNVNINVLNKLEKRDVVSEYNEFEDNSLMLMEISKGGNNNEVYDECNVTVAINKINLEYFVMANDEITTAKAKSLPMATRGRDGVYYMGKLKNAGEFNGCKYKLDDFTVVGSESDQVFSLNSENNLYEFTNTRGLKDNDDDEFYDASDGTNLVVVRENGSTNNYEIFGVTVMPGCKVSLNAGDRYISVDANIFGLLKFSAFCDSQCNVHLCSPFGKYEIKGSDVGLAVWNTIKEKVVQPAFTFVKNILFKLFKKKGSS